MRLTEVFTFYTHMTNEYHLKVQIPRTVSNTPHRKDMSPTWKTGISQQNPPDILCMVARAENTHRSIYRLSTPWFEGNNGKNSITNPISMYRPIWTNPMRTHWSLPKCTTNEERLWLITGATACPRRIPLHPSDLYRMMRFLMSHCMHLCIATSECFWYLILCSCTVAARCKA
jgi:hypothetical protein